MNTQNEKQFVTGFNNGYLLAKYLPELFVKLIKNLNLSNEYLQGFFSGSKEFEMEFLKDQLEDLKKIRNNSKDLGRNREKIR